MRDELTLPILACTVVGQLVCEALLVISFTGLLYRDSATLLSPTAARSLIGFFRSFLLLDMLVLWCFDSLTDFNLPVCAGLFCWWCIALTSALFAITPPSDARREAAVSIPIFGVMGCVAGFLTGLLAAMSGVF